MSLFNIMSKMAREMDKQRFQRIKEEERQKAEAFNEPVEIFNIEIDREADDYDYVKENIDEITDLYNLWVEEYVEIDNMRESMNIELEFEDYLQSLEDAITLTQNTYEEIDLVPEVFEVSFTTQQYLQKVKENYLLALECHIRRVEVMRDGIIETLENGIAIENTAELANQFLDKASFYVKSAFRYMEKSFQSATK